MIDEQPTHRDICRHASVLSELYGSPVVVYFSPEQFGKSIDDSDLDVFLNFLNRAGKPKDLTIVLNTPGGKLDSVRRLTILLRGFTSSLTSVVAFKAFSSGTFLALSAERVVMGALSRVSPIDPVLVRDSSDQSASPTPGAITSEDIRSFPLMAQNWFGMNSEASRAEALEVLCRKVFPVTLSRLYRAETYSLSFMAQLLERQLPDIIESERNQIAKRLMYGYPSHQHSITSHNLTELGLNIHMASQVEETALKAMWEDCGKFIKSGMSQSRLVDCLLFSNSFFAHSEAVFEQDEDTQEEFSLSTSGMTTWHVLQDID